MLCLRYFSRAQIAVGYRGGNQVGWPKGNHTKGSLAIYRVGIKLRSIACKGSCRGCASLDTCWRLVRNGSRGYCRFHGHGRANCHILVLEGSEHKRKLVVCRNGATIKPLVHHNLDRAYGVEIVINVPLEHRFIGIEFVAILGHLVRGCITIYWIFLHLILDATGGFVVFR